HDRRRNVMSPDGIVSHWLGCLTGGCPWALGPRGLFVTIAGALLAVLAVRRTTTALWTLRAMSVTPKLSRMLARRVTTHSYSADGLFRADGAGELVVEQRKAGIDRLVGDLAAGHPRSAACGESIRAGLSDLRFTDASRVPPPFARFMRERFSLSSVVTESKGLWLRDLDSHSTLDVSGSDGLNVAGYSRFTEWITNGLARAKDLGPVLGPVDGVVAESVEVLGSISKLDEVSFHMSGTEAVMAAVRLARFNTRRKLIVCFAGAYHGWWDGVQPGLGSERAIDD